MSTQVTRRQTFGHARRSIQTTQSPLTRRSNWPRTPDRPDFSAAPGTTVACRSSLGGLSSPPLAYWRTSECMAARLDVPAAR